MAKSALILVWAFLVHCAAIYLFTSGFLLSRLSLPNLSAPNEAYKSQATHSRAVILIIDALRFDFIASSPPSPISPAHHHIFTLPQELTAQNPRRSFIFDTYVDPPTTTLQRIKGITTGSLPTFVDLGNNFGAASIEEDSLIQQFKLAGKKVRDALSLHSCAMCSNINVAGFYGRRHLDVSFPRFLRQEHDVPLRLLQRRGFAYSG